MTVPLSPSKVKKLLKYYFSGLQQPVIAKKLGISQGSVSHWVEKFRKQAATDGLLNTAKEYDMFDEIQGLRSLSVELHKAGLTTEDAKAGVKIIKKFNHLGVEPAQHELLVEVCNEVNTPGFTEAALELCAIKSKSGLSCEEALSKYQQATQELPLAETKLAELKAKLETISAKVADKKKELRKIEDLYKLMVKKAEETIAKLDKDVTDKMTESEVNQEEIEQIASLKAELAKQGLDIPTLMKMAKEFSHGDNKD